MNEYDKRVASRSLDACIMNKTLTIRKRYFKYAVKRHLYELSIILKKNTRVWWYVTGYNVKHEHNKRQGTIVKVYISKTDGLRFMCLVSTKRGMASVNINKVRVL